MRAEPLARADLFARLLSDVEAFMKQHPEERPWTYSIFSGTDGSHVFRGGTGQSIVIDCAGAMWRGRSLEDFETAYDLSNNECRISSLTPLYEQMRQYTLVTSP